MFAAMVLNKHEAIFHLAILEILFFLILRLVIFKKRPGHTGVKHKQISYRKNDDVARSFDGLPYPCLPFTRSLKCFKCSAMFSVL